MSRFDAPRYGSQDRGGVEVVIHGVALGWETMSSAGDPVPAAQVLPPVGDRCCDLVTIDLRLVGVVHAARPSTLKVSVRDDHNDRHGSRGAGRAAPSATAEARRRCSTSGPTSGGLSRAGRSKR